MSEGFATGSRTEAASLPPPPELNTRIERWKGELLDLSGRNRMLYFKDTRQTLKLPVSEHAAWQDLIDGGLSLTNVVHSSSVPDDDGAPSGDELLKKARRLADTNRTFVEEQGVHVLHACFAWLRWVDTTRQAQPGDTAVELSDGRKGRLARSPLLFVPVRFDTSANQLRLRRQEDVPIETNLTLQHYMRQQFGIEPDIDEDDDLDPEAIVTAWEAVIGHRERWMVEVESATRVDVFSFKKIALFRQLERSAHEIAQQPLLRALCGDATVLSAASSIPKYESLDREVPPGEVAIVVPADASQIQALLAVKSGASIVIQGPPGTGKSQTITNLIAAAIADRKKVLFVAEKRAARDVVVGNLESARLGEVVLHLTEDVSGSRARATGKRDIAQQLIQVLEAGPRSYHDDEAALHRVSELRNELNEYVEVLHSPLSAPHWSTPYGLLGRWAAGGGELQTDVLPLLPSVRDTDDAWLESALDAAAAIDDLAEPVLTGISPAWLDCSKLPRTSKEAEEVVRAVALLVESQAIVARAICDRPIPSTASVRTVEDVERLAQDLQGLATLFAMRGSGKPWMKPRYWRLRRLEKHWNAHGGEPVRGDEAGCVARLRTVMNELAYARELVARWLPGVAGSDGFAAQSVAAAPFVCELAALMNTVRVWERLDRASSDLQPALRQLVKGRQANGSIRTALDSALRWRWALEAVASHPSLAVESPSRERLRQRFIAADAAARKHSIAAALNSIAPGRPGIQSVAPKDSELGILRQQIAAKRRKSLRWLFSHTANTILQLKPCIVGSPLAVAQFLSHPAFQFDLVVFDEASQIPTADAVVPMARGRQVVVVGDSQQMPPTSFFDRTLEEQAGDEGDAAFESVLQECEALLPPSRLLWHYRSRDERLIAFSNQQFYDGTLLTFPASWAEHPSRGVKFVHTPDAVYGKGGSRSNPVEAERVIDLLVQELAADPTKDVGVTAMSVNQASEIQNRIETRLFANPELQPWVDAGNRVKNLETIQGDECDVMLLSFGYGRDSAGTSVLNFGPLSRDDGYRRLNVAVTRAREKTVIVSSLRASDIPPSVGKGGQLVRKYLDYAERGPVALADGVTAPATDTFDSLFEEAVAMRLRGLGWTVDTQVGVSRFRVDLGVRDPSEAGRYLAGIECDGATYHAAQTARDRDIARQEVLEHLGWRILRIWSPEWFANPDKILGEVDAFLRAAVTAADSARNPADDTLQAEESTLSLTTSFVRGDPHLPPGTVEYRPHRAALPTSRLDEWITRIVADEGPLHEEELLQAIRDDLGYGKIGSRLREEWLDAVESAIERSLIVQRNGWLWPPEMDPRRVKVRIAGQGAKRLFEHYSDEELWRAMEIACTYSGSLPRESVPAATVQLLGYNLTSHVASLLAELVPHAIRHGYLMESNGIVTSNALDARS